MPDTWAGRCYCGACHLTVDAAPQTVSYCHCSDCRRLTAAPVAAFAAFPEASATISSDIAVAQFEKPGVRRQFCGQCGSALTAVFDYLPKQVYVPLGVLDNAAALVPRIHCHDAARLPWLTIADDVPRAAQSGRCSLNGEAQAG